MSIGRSLRVGIVGCGIAGQTAAILLAERGHAVTIFERFERPAPLGAGLLLQPSGLAVLQVLGMLEEARGLGARVDGIDGRTLQGRKILDLRYADLAHGCAGLGIHRGHLFGLLHRRLLRTPVRLVTGIAIAAIEQRGNELLPHSDDGRDVGAFDLIVACDGAHSRLRGRHGAMRADPVYPWGCMWIALRDRDRVFSGLLHQRFDGTHTMIGVLPIGAGAGDDEPTGDWVTLFWSLKIKDFEAFWRQDWPSWRARLQAMWPALAPLIGQVEPDGFTGASYRDVALRRWRAGRILFLGDAAHATSPQLGQGANLAMLDALALADCLDHCADLDEALDVVERRRRGQVDFYRRASRWLTPFYQSDRAFLGWLRDLSFGRACRIAPARALMLSTLAGLRRNLWRADQPSSVGLAPLARISRR